MTAPIGGSGVVEARLRAHGLELPPGHTVTTLTERPDLDPLVDAHHAGLWEPFMLESEVAARMFPRAHADWPDHPLILLAGLFGSGGRWGIGRTVWGGKRGRHDHDPEGLPAVHRRHRPPGEAQRVLP